MENTDLVLYDPHSLPPELAIDQYHPEGDAYMQSLRAIQRAVVAASAKLKPLQVSAVKMTHSGLSYTEIGKRLQRAQNTIARWLALPEAQQLLNLLRHYQSSMHGARQEQRKHMLWRIAVDNEQTDPRVAITAVAEMNRMEVAIHTVEAKANITPTTVNIVINQDQLPRTTLDG